MMNIDAVGGKNPDYLLLPLRLWSAYSHFTIP